MVFLLFLLSFAPAAPAAPPPGPDCATLMAALGPASGANVKELLRAGAEREGEILAGEASSALNAARRELTNQLKKDGLAEALAKKLSAPGEIARRRPGEILLALDAYLRVDPALFAAIGAAAMKAAPRMEPAARRQLASRLISGAGIVPAAPARTLLRALAGANWSRGYLAGDANAARNLLTAINKISEETADATALARNLGPARVLSADWIHARQALGGRPGPAVESQVPAMDYAFARVLARRLAELLKDGDPAASGRFAAREKAIAAGGAAYRDEERVKSLFAEFGLAD